MRAPLQVRPLYTPREVAAMLHVDAKTATRMEKAGRIPRAIQLPAEHLRHVLERPDRWLAARGLNPDATPIQVLAAVRAELLNDEVAA